MYGTVRTVVWEDGGGDPASYPMSVQFVPVRASPCSSTQSTKSTQSTDPKTHQPHPAQPPFYCPIMKIMLTLIMCKVEQCRVIAYLAALLLLLRK